MFSKSALKWARVLSVLVALSPVCSALAWWDAGHLTVAEIAYQRLTPEAKTEVDRLVNVLTPFYPASDTFVKASTWLDQLGPNDFTPFRSWHFTVIPYDPDGLLTEHQRQLIVAANHNADIGWCLEQCLTTLRSAKADDFAKAFMLRLFIHCVADVHQPMHTTSRFSAETPTGDCGGNLFKVRSQLAPNLHFLWDSALGALPPLEMGAPVTDDALERIKLYVEHLVARYPQEHIPEAACLDTTAWIRESHRLAVDVAYDLPFDSVPSETYIRRGQTEAERRLALAGYRLAAVLNDTIINNK